MKRTGNFLAAGSTFGLVAVLLSGCAGTTTVTQPAAQTAPKQMEAVQQHAQMPIPETPPLEGKVIETMNAGAYTYISLEKAGKKGWVAVPATEVKVGQEIKVRRGTEMGPFSSKSLNRSFDNIIFSSGLETETQNQTTQAQPSVDAAMKLPAGHKAVDKNAKPKGMAAMFAATGGEMADDLSGKVVETMDAGGYTYVNLEKDGKQTWAAVPTMKVSVGEQMELKPGAIMTNFTSKSLDKTFERVVFSAGPLNSK